MAGDESLEGALSRVENRLNYGLIEDIYSLAASYAVAVSQAHCFNDGNKRSGAFLFVDFLNKNNRLLNRDGQPVINDNGLAALTLLVAESSPTQKETMIALIMNMLANP